MAKYLYFWICSCAIVLFSCGDNSNEANAQYEKARKLFENGQYANAKNAIDSIELLYPKAFKQIKAGRQCTQSETNRTRSSQEKLPVRKRRQIPNGRELYI